MTNDQLRNLLHKEVQVVICARTHFAIWWEYVGTDTYQDHYNFRLQFTEFANLDSEAHFLSAIIYLAQLLERNPKNRNLGSLLVAAADAKIPAAALESAKARLDALADVGSKIAILRSNAFAHRSAKLTKSGVFDKADISANQIRDAFDEILSIVNSLFRAAGDRPWKFDDAAREQFATISRELSS